MFLFPTTYKRVFRLFTGSKCQDFGRDPDGTFHRHPRLCLVAMAFRAGGLGATVRAESALKLEDPGFETGTGWKIGGDMGKMTVGAARTGKRGLRVIDRDKGRGSSVRSAPVSVPPNRALALRFFARTRDAGGVGVYLDLYDVNGKILTRQDRHNQVIFGIPDTKGKWRRFTVVARTSSETASATIWVHSFNAAVAQADFDDFTLSVLEPKEIGKVTTTHVPRPGPRFSVPTPARIAEIAKLLPDHPMPVGWPITDRTAWDRLAADPAAPGIIRRAEAAAKTPPPELPDDLYLEFSRTGNRSHYQSPYGRRASRLNALLLAECLENKGRFVVAIVRELEAICGEKTWVLPAHDRGQENFNGKRITVDLGSSSRARLLATAVAWLRTRLPADVCDRVYGEIDRRIFQPYLAAVRSGETRGNWWMRGTNNWNPVCTANVVGTALTLIADRNTRAEFIAAMEISNPYFLAGFTDDGYCSEGVGYWNYGFGHYLLLGLIVRNATAGKLDIFKNEPEKSRRIARYGLDIQVQPGIAPAFADCNVRAAPSASVLAMIAIAFPELVPKVVRAPARLSGDAMTVGLLGLCPELESRRTPIEDSGDYELPLRTWFSNAQILVCRAAADGTTPAFGAAIKGGNNAEHHNHNDVSSFVIVLDGHPYLVDPGNEVYTRRTFSRQRYESKVLNSYGHDVPRVAGRLQSTGRSAAARVLTSRFTDAVDRLDLDIHAAYAVRGLKGLVRTFEFDRVKREVRITDSVEFDKPESFETALVTFDRIHRRSDSELVFYDARHSVVVSFVATGGELVVHEDDIENPGRPTPHRIAFAFSKPVKQAEIRFTIRPAPLAADLPGIYIAPDISSLHPRLSDAVVIQAEEFSAQVGGNVEICDKKGADGRAVKYWNHEGHALEWRFHVPTGGWYAVEVRCCHALQDATVTRRVLLDDHPIDGKGMSFPFPYTGGWSSKADNWRNVWLARNGQAVLVRLGKGGHTLRMENDCGQGLNLDRVRLTPVTPPPE